MKSQFLRAVFLIFVINSTSAWATESLRISPQKLQKQLHHVVVLDARTPALFEQGHIEGALNFPVSKTYDHKKINGNVVRPNRLKKLVRQLGLTTTTPIVVNDNGQLMDAARLFWTLEVYGFKNVKVLDGGFMKWQAKQYPISFEAVNPKPSQYIPTINYQRIATKLTTQLATKLKNETVIDARGGKFYNGKVSRTTRYGHIPTAINIPATHNLQGYTHFQSFQSLDKLKSVYQNIPKSNKVIIYCSFGRISAVNYFALRELGYNVANYDASWQEWGNDLKLPIEK